MTVICWTDKTIAVDSLVSGGGEHHYINKFADLTHGLVEGVHPIAVAACGSCTLIEKVVETFGVDRSKDLVEHMRGFKYNDRTCTFIIIYKKDDVFRHKTINLSTRTLPRIIDSEISKKHRLVSGSGANAVKIINNSSLSKIGAKETAFLASKMEDFCGGPIRYINYSDPDTIKTYKPTEKQLDMMLNEMKMGLLVD